MIDVSAWTALVTVIVTDIALAGDNAVVVGVAAARLPPHLRHRAILVGIAAATVLRILFALITLQLLAIVGLLLAGGLLLLWVAWKLWREVQAQRRRSRRERQGRETAAEAPPRQFWGAVTHIVAADVSMSLDNVLAVAGAARHHPWVLVVGLGLSVALMGIAANLIARWLGRYHWISYLGIGVILVIALRMIWEGSQQVMAAVPPL